MGLNLGVRGHSLVERDPVVTNLLPRGQLPACRDGNSLLVHVHYKPVSAAETRIFLAQLPDCLLDLSTVTVRLARAVYPDYLVQPHRPRKRFGIRDLIADEKAIWKLSWISRRHSRWTGNSHFSSFVK